jgi:hypothetical protein
MKRVDLVHGASRHAGEPEEMVREEGHVHADEHQPEIACRMAALRAAEGYWSTSSRPLFSSHTHTRRVAQPDGVGTSAQRQQGSSSYPIAAPPKKDAKKP